MKGTVIGIKLVDFTNEDTGELIQGTRLFVIAEDLDCFGKSCSPVWVGAGTPLEKKLAEYLKNPESFLGYDVEFSFKQGSKKVAQFDVIGKSDKKSV